jgi:hypothetical protein
MSSNKGWETTTITKDFIVHILPKISYVATELERTTFITKFKESLTQLGIIMGIE